MQDRSIFPLLHSSYPKNEIKTQNPCFVCRRCRAQIVSEHNYYGTVRGTVNGILCDFPENVGTAYSTFPRYQYDVPVWSVRCRCNRHIGERRILPNPTSQEPYQGDYIFHLDRIRYWDGTQLRDADTREPVQH